MRGGYEPSDFGVLPKPGKVLKLVMLGLFAIWLAFALALNWGGASEDLFLRLCGSGERIFFSGEVWRLFTAALMHLPSGSPWHIITTLLGLYFLAPELEKAFGPARFVRFLLIAAVVPYAVQAVVEVALPPSISSRLVPEYWFGAVPVLEAIAIAWALNFRGQTVRLMFVLPISSRGLIIFVVAMSVLYVIVGAQRECGLIAPFFGMAIGWMFGAGTPSPARRWYLKLRLLLLDREAMRVQTQRKKRVQGSSFRVIAGGRDDDDKPRNKRDLN